MTAGPLEDGWLEYRSQRAWTQVESHFIYREKGSPEASVPGTLEYFLAERYLLYAHRRDRLWSGRVYHKPYPLQEAEVELCDDRLMLLSGFSPTNRAPDLAHYASGVQVDVYPLMPN